MQSSISPEKVRKLTANLYDKVAEKYTATFLTDPDRDIVDLFLSFLPKNSRILDVGCGPGIIANYMHKKGYQIEGIDISEKMIELAKKRAPQCRFRLLDMRDLDYPQDSFDGIVALYSIIHIPKSDIFDVFTKFSRVLKSGGYLLVAVQEGKGEVLLSDPLAPGEKVFLNLFEKEELLEILNKLGFNILHISKRSPVVGEFPYPHIRVIAQKVTKHT